MSFVLQDGNDDDDDNVPMSNIDEVTLDVFESGDTIEEEEPPEPEREPTPPPPKPIIHTPAPPAHVQSNQSVQSVQDTTRKVDNVPPKPKQKDIIPANSHKVSPNASDVRPVEVPKSHHTNGQPQKVHQEANDARRPSDQLPHAQSAQTGSNRDLRSNATGGAAAGPAPHAGTLADLKRQRALMLQNALRARDPAFQGLTSSTGSLANSTSSLHSQSNSVLPANEQNGRSPNLSDIRSDSSAPSPYIPTVPIGDPPKRRYTATSPSEIIGGEEDKQNCCIIL